MPFPEDVVDRAWERQNGLCAACGKRLEPNNRGRQNRAAWEPHHRVPERMQGTNYLQNCVILCTTLENCHLYVGHDGNYQESIILSFDELPYLRG